MILIALSLQENPQMSAQAESDRALKTSGRHRRAMDFQQPQHVLHLRDGGRS